MRKSPTGHITIRYHSAACKLSSLLIYCLCLQHPTVLDQRCFRDTVGGHIGKVFGATAPKVFWAAFSSAILSSFFFTEESSPDAICLFASSRFWRALASVTVGYAPKDSSFSLAADCTLSCSPAAANFGGSSIGSQAEAARDAMIQPIGAVEGPALNV